MHRVQINGYPLGRLATRASLALGILVLIVAFLKWQAVALALPLRIVLALLVLAVLGSILTYPFVTPEIDSREVVVRWSWLFGAISRARSIPLNRIDRIVYSVTRVGKPAAAKGEAAGVLSRHSLYLRLIDGNFCHVFPENRANPELARRFAAALQKYTGRPSVVNREGSGDVRARPPANDRRRGP